MARCSNKWWEWFQAVMQDTPTPATAQVPVMMMQAMIYEASYPGLVEGQRKVNPPVGYVPFADKVAVLKQMKDWREPPMWKKGLPTATA